MNGTGMNSEGYPSEGNRVALEWRDPYTLKANPKNPRRHPQRQRQALHEAIMRLGWLQPPLFNDRTDRLIDGHMRVQEALAEGWTEIPVLVIDLDEADEAAALASIDAITMAAELDVPKYVSLLQDLDDSLRDSLRELDQDLELDEDEDTSLPSASPQVADVHLIPGEQYNYVVLLFRTDLDYLRAIDHFGIGKPALDLFHSAVVGKTRVVDGAKYLAGLGG